MKFHIKERYWTLREEFIVRNQQGQPTFMVKGKFFHIGDNLVIHNLNTQRQVAHIKQEILALTPHYAIFCHGQHWATIHEKLPHFFGERFKIQLENGGVRHIEGNIWNWNFTISDGRGNLLAHVGRHISLFPGSYAVDIAQGADVPFIIALAITFEMIRMHKEEKRI